MAGTPTSRIDGLTRALTLAGVRPGEPVMLVGHSQGGLIAVNAARDAVRGGEFNVTHVVTAGAPVGLIVGAVPSSVQVLALENSQDVVPHVDGVMNPDLPNVTTAAARSGDGTVGGDHRVDTAYVPLAAAVEASGDGSIRDFLTGADGFFRATAVETHTYQIQRSY
jgi:pimeloyl-ACP methyl ester carboxylesterase